ncbi:MAG TPA: GNAT family N-acetyltransferase [Caulobacteraceae bacterium]|nr:GNAT family N-acetyltransferase [Caulobacteraceae bacterium]
MPTITSRDYAGLHDFRAMQALAQTIWNFDARHHIGGLAWERFEHVGREPEWPTRLWLEEGRVVAWAWLYEHDPDVLYFQVHPDRPALLDEALDWFERVADADELEVMVSEREHRLRRALVARGFTARPHAPYGLSNRRDLTDLPELALPPGHRVRSMAETPDPDRRAAAHRAAWSRISGREHLPPGLSRVTGESYRQVMAAWPYRPDLDWVLEAPDGRWVANCCVWLDEAHGVGNFEPVGVDADLRRRGYGYAVCLAGLHALRAAGARWATVGSRGDDDYPVPRRLYFKLGFRTYAASQVYGRKRRA